MDWLPESEKSRRIRWHVFTKSTNVTDGQTDRRTDGQTPHDDIARVWNSLLRHVTSSSSLEVLKSRLKTRLFSVSYPNIPLMYTAPRDTRHFGHLSRFSFSFVFVLHYSAST